MGEREDNRRPAFSGGVGAYVVRFYVLREIIAGCPYNDLKKQELTDEYNKDNDFFWEEVFKKLDFYLGQQKDLFCKQLLPKQRKRLQEEVDDIAGNKKMAVDVRARIIRSVIKSLPGFICAWDAQTRGEKMLEKLEKRVGEIDPKEKQQLLDYAQQLRNYAQELFHNAQQVLDRTLCFKKTNSPKGMVVYHKSEEEENRAIQAINRVVMRDGAFPKVLAAPHQEEERRRGDVTLSGVFEYLP